MIRIKSDYSVKEEINLQDSQNLTNNIKVFKLIIQKTGSLLYPANPLNWCYKADKNRIDTKINHMQNTSVKLKSESEYHKPRDSTCDSTRFK